MRIENCGTESWGALTESRMGRGCLNVRDLFSGPEALGWIPNGLVSKRLFE